MRARDPDLGKIRGLWRIFEGEQGVCVSACFTKDATTDFVSAEQIFRSLEEPSRASLLAWFRKNGYRKDIDAMLSVDAFVYNTDRHLRNFGIFRDAATSELKEFVPLFDNGSCLGWKVGNAAEKQDVKPFDPDIDKQLRMVRQMPKFAHKDDLLCLIDEIYGNFGISDERMRIAQEMAEIGWHRVKTRSRELEQEEIVM